MKKVGIITHYNNSRNYGGVLQAYALCKVINDLGADCEQIPYAYESINNLQYGVRKKHIIDSLVKKIGYRLYRSVFCKRIEVFASFRNNFIPHNSSVYSDNTLQTISESYDVFITGSDQVWNPTNFHPGYYLDFVKSRKKISYAASISSSSITPKQEDIYKTYLVDFSAISVREENDVVLLNYLLPQSVKCVLDPTLLLNRKEWDQIAEMRIVKEKYLFTYFLSENCAEREFAKKYALKHKLKIVSIPHVLGEFRKCDFHYGDYPKTDASPSEFLALIRDAECIVTDSFHAVAFSCIYEKLFFAFERSDSTGMITRLKNITSLFGVEKHLLINDYVYDYTNSINVKTIKFEKDSFMKKKRESLSFLRDNIFDYEE